MNLRDIELIAGDAIQWYQRNPGEETGSVAEHGPALVARNYTKYRKSFIEKHTSIDDSSPDDSLPNKFDRNQMIWEFYKAAETGLKANPNQPIIDNAMQLAEAIQKTDYFLEQIIK
jgi:hypothetical protein